MDTGTIKNDVKPLILSIESSSNVCGISLSRGDELLAEYSIFERNLHDKLLSELTRRILADLNLKLDNLDAVAVSAGPGSFTGLRIGAALAKAICFGNKPALIGVPTLAAIANECLSKINNEGTPVRVVLPSHKDLVYHQRFDGSMKELTIVEICTINELNENIQDHEIICSPGLDLKPAKEFKLDSLKPSIIARLAYEYYKAGKFEDADKFVPAYYFEFTPKVK